MLHGDIRVNGQHLGEWKAERASHIDEAPGPDDVVVYACEARIVSTPQGNPAVLERFDVTHRFGDGALALAARVLGQAYNVSDSAV